MFIETQESGQVLDRLVVLFYSEIKNVHNDVKQKPKQVLPPKPKEVFQLVVNLESKIRSHFREAKDQNKALVQAAKCWQ